jgi:hypothetical protein
MAALGPYSLGGRRLADVIAAGASAIHKHLKKERYSLPSMIARRQRKANFEPEVTLLQAAAAISHHITS